MKKLLQSGREVFTMVDGNKSYILGTLAILLWAGIQFGLWSQAEVIWLFELLGILGVFTFRSAIKKIGE